MSKTAVTDHPVHDLIARRWSPCGFSDRLVDRDDLCSLLEAARWAASSYNEQPWSFIVAPRDDTEQFARLLDCLVPGNQQWAKNAAVLLLTVASERFTHNGTPNQAARHDIGLAVGNLSLEATARGISVHQMIGILPDKARQTFRIPDDHHPLTALAVGYRAPSETLPQALRERDESPRQRKPISTFTYGSQWGQPSPIVTD